MNYCVTLHDGIVALLLLLSLWCHYYTVHIDDVMNRGGGRGVGQRPACRLDACYNQVNILHKNALILPTIFFNFLLFWGRRHSPQDLPLTLLPPPYFRITATGHQCNLDCKSL